MKIKNNIIGWLIGFFDKEINRWLTLIPIIIIFLIALTKFWYSFINYGIKVEPWIAPVIILCVILTVLWAILIAASDIRKINRKFEE